MLVCLPAAVGPRSGVAQMTLRRYAPLKPSRGTMISAKLRAEVLARDRWHCVGPQVLMLGPCFGRVELDHVRASGGLGMKSPTERGNLASLCSTHHRVKTLNGRKWRPLLLDYIAQRDGEVVE